MTGWARPSSLERGEGPGSGGTFPGSADGAGRGRVACEVGGRLCAAGDLELGQDAGDVVLDRLLGEGEIVADLLVGLAVRDLLEDPLLLWGQARELLVRHELLPLAETIEDGGRDARVKERVAGAHGPDRVEQVT